MSIVTNKIYENKEELISKITQYHDGSGNIKVKVLVDILFALQEQIDTLAKKKVK